MDGLVSPDGFIVNSARARRIGQSTSAGNATRFPLVDFPQFYTQIEICKYSRGGISGISSEEDLFSLTRIPQSLPTIPGGLINLPLPFSIVDAENVAYEEVSIGNIVGSATETLSRAIGGEGSASGIDMAQTATDLTGLFLGGLTKLTNELRGTTVGGIADKFGLGPEQLLNIYRAQQGVALNPFNVVLLQGPRYKNHMLTWKMSPNNQQEMLVIKNIISKLKKAQRPEKGIITFGFPNVLRIKLLAENNLMMFKPCVIETVSVNYTPGNTPSLHRDGSPTVYEIRLALKELEYWFNEDNVFDENL